MKTVTDAEFRANMGNMLDYIRSGGTLVITGEDNKQTILSGSDLTPEQHAAMDRAKKIRDQIDRSPLTQARREMENRYPDAFAAGRAAISFEEAMKRTREKHAEVIKKLEDN